MLILLLKAEDKDVGFLSETFLKLENKLRQAPDALKLDFFSQMNFIGLFVKEGMYDFLQDCVSIFCRELSKQGNGTTFITNFKSTTYYTFNNPRSEFWFR